MTRVSRLIAVFALFGALTLGVRAQAEDIDFPGEDISGEFASILALLEPFISGGIPTSSVINMGGCTPTMTFGFPTITVHFTNTITCPLAGDVIISLFPFGTKVRLEVFNVPFIEAIDVDVMLYFRREGDIRYTYLVIQNGRLAIRPAPQMPLQELMINGLGIRAKQKNVGYQSQNRVNVFQKESGNGFAILKTTSKLNGEPKSKKVERCDLTGGDITDVQGGELSNCRVVREK